MGVQGDPRWLIGGKKVVIRWVVPGGPRASRM